MNIRTIGCISIVSVVLAACGTSGGGGGGSVSLNLGHPFPPKHVIQDKVLNGFVDDVRKASDSSVDIEIIPGGALGDAAGIYENVVAGGQDIGWSLQGYTAGRFPVTQLIEDPLTFDNATQATEALWDAYEKFPEFREEYKDVKVLALWTTDTGQLWTKKKSADSDISGMTLRAPGSTMNSFIKSVGGAPVGMPAPEIYDSMERGVIDGLMLPDSGIASFNLFDQVTSMLECNCYTSASFVVMNKNAWNDLSADQQAAIDKLAGRKLSMANAAAYDAEQTEVRARLAKEGIAVKRLGGAELDRWHTAADVVTKKLVADADKAGAPGQEILDHLTSSATK